MKLHKPLIVSVLFLGLTATMAIVAPASPLLAPAWMTGDAAADFTAHGYDAVVYDPSEELLPKPPFPPTWSSGWDLLAVYFDYDQVNDIMYVGIDCNGVCGDADGNGNPGAWGGPLAGGASDRPDLKPYEVLAMALDNGDDGTYEVAVGVSIFDDINSFGTYEYGGWPANFVVSKPNHTPLYAQPSSTWPDVEFSIGDFSSLVTGPGLQFGVKLFSGSFSDSGIAEDFVSGLVRLHAAIGNYVWIDENGDGYQDAGEPGLPNVIVELYASDGTTPLDTTVTDAHGGYLFPNLAPGTYIVQVDATSLPAGLTQTTNPVLAGADFGNQSQPYTVTVGPGQENLTADFGYDWGNPDGNTGTGAIGDRVWIDANGNGVQDAGEPGIGGVQLTIYYDSNGDGKVEPGVDLPYTGAVDQNGNTGTGTTTTEPDGSYIFDKLPAGAYIVVVDTPPTGYTQTGDPDHFSTSGTNNDNRTTTPVILGPGDVFLNADFGYQPTDDGGDLDGRIGDTVWLDANANGVYEPGQGEHGIPGVTVALALDANGNGHIDAGEIIATDTTDANGQYLFDGLPAGDYLVWVNDTDNVLAELAQTYDADDGIGPFASPNLSALTLPAGGVNLDQDFGYAPPGHSQGDGLIGDTVFLDMNYDGQPNQGEGIEGIVVNLYDDAGNLVATSTTDENGNYYFGGLSPNATYQVMVDTATLPPGLINSVDPDGTLDSQSVVNLGAPGSDGGNDPDGLDNGINLGQDFGYVPSGTAGRIGDLVWLDANADGFNNGTNGPDGIVGTDDDEPGIAGVTLDLYYDANGNGKVDPGDPKVASTVTDANGGYLFDNLPTDGPDGNSYVVDVTDQNGVLFGYWHSLGTTGQNDNSQVDPYSVSISPAAPSNLTADFGYYVEPGALGNRVWEDTNYSGIQDAGEAGLAGVAVTLQITYPDGTVTTLVTTTDANGFYSFGNLLLDEDYNGDGLAPEPAHTISVATPAGYAPTLLDQGTNDKLDSDNHAGVSAQPVQGLTNVAAQPNPDHEQTIASYDFGFVRAVCDVQVAKTCQLPLEPTTPFVCSDAKPIDSLTMIWDGTQAIKIKAWKGAVGSTLLATIDNIKPGDEVTVPGYAGSPNDVIWEIFYAGTDNEIGESTFHLSCSDADMNGPEDCGKLEGDGKGQTGYLNLWKLEGMAGNGQVLDCTPTPSAPSDTCEFLPGPTPSCATLGAPTSLTFRYTGGGCAASNNPQGGKATCSGSINPSLPVLVTTSNSGYTITPTTVNPGEEFTVSASSFNADSYFNLTNAGGTEALKIHTSCSQVLAVDDVFGSLTLVAFNGQRAGNEVTYNYELTNNGSDLSNVMLNDVPLGPIAGPFSLPSGDIQTFQKVVEISETTVNTGTVSGQLVTGQVCQASDTATVNVIPCVVNGGAFTIGDRKIEWQLTNNGNNTVTIGQLDLQWPSVVGNLKKVKVEGDTIYDTPDLPPPSATITSFENTLDKRQIKPGETQRLIIEFDYDGRTTTQPEDYYILLTFTEGCSVAHGSSSGTKTVEVRVAAGSDDAEEQGPDTVETPGSMYLISTDLEMVRDDDPPSYGAQLVGMRFNGINVPQGATISNAYIRFSAVSPDSPNTNNNTANLTIQGQAADNAATFTSTRYNLSNRPRTTASVNWIPTAWSTGNLYNTPDLSAIVKQIIDRAGWASGNSMVLIVRCTDGVPLASCGSRSAASYNGYPSSAPLLHIEWQ